MNRYCYLIAALVAVFVTTEASAQLFRGGCRAKRSCCVHPTACQSNCCAKTGCRRPLLRCRRKSSCQPCPTTTIFCQEVRKDPYRDCLDWCEANCGPFEQRDCKNYCYCVYRTSGPCLAPICNPVPPPPPGAGVR